MTPRMFYTLARVLAALTVRVYCTIFFAFRQAFGL